MSRYEDELEEQFIEEPENDLEEPADGRDGTTDHGSSDDPDSLDAMDPLRRDTFLLDEDQERGGAPDDEEGTGQTDVEDVLDEDSEWDGLEDEDDGDDQR